MLKFQMRAGCVKCGATIGEKKCLWDVPPTFWCDLCFKASFPITAAQGLFCTKELLNLPEISLTEHLSIEASTVTVWSSVDRNQAWYHQYPEGLYYPVYISIRQLQSGERISTTHMADGKCVAIGQPWQISTPTPPVAKVGPRVSTASKPTEHPASPPMSSLNTQTVYTMIAPEMQWTYDEGLKEILEIPLLKEEEPISQTGVPVSQAAEPKSQAEEVVLMPILSPRPETPLLEEPVESPEMPDLSEMLVIDSWDESMGTPHAVEEVTITATDEVRQPADDIIVLTIPEDEYLFTD